MKKYSSATVWIIAFVLLFLSVKGKSNFLSNI